MVVKSSSAPPSPAAAAADPLRRVTPSSGVKKSKETEVEFSRLKSLVPTISKKQSVSKLDVILEAIRYIDQLQDQLIDQINEQKISISASALLVGKENGAPSSLTLMDEEEEDDDDEEEENSSGRVGKRQRHRSQ